MNLTLVDWSGCEKIWKLCSDYNTYCGCIGRPSRLMWIIIFVILGIIYIIIDRMRVRSCKK